MFASIQRNLPKPSSLILRLKLVCFASCIGPVIEGVVKGTLDSERRLSLGSFYFPMDVLSLNVSPSLQFCWLFSVLFSLTYILCRRIPLWTAFLLIVISAYVSYATSAMWGGTYVLDGYICNFLKHLGTRWIPLSDWLWPWKGYWF